MTVPVTVIGGYLGAGKTTLINQLLRQADGRRIAVLVNEFGALPIDEDLIVAQDGDVIAIAGGCVCCAFGDNLVGTLGDMAKRAPQPDAILIEASGVAIPASIASVMSLVMGVELAGLIVLADAETIEARAQDKYIGDTIHRQLQGADIVILTKTDLVSADQQKRVMTWAQAAAPGAEVIASADLGAAAVLGGSAFEPDAAAALTDHSAQYKSIAFQQVAPVDAHVLGQTLSDEAMGLVRAKGFCKCADGTLQTVQVVGRRWSVAQATKSQAPGLVCIGVTDRFATDALTQAMKRLGFLPSEDARKLAEG